MSDLVKTVPRVHLTCTLCGSYSNRKDNVKIHLLNAHKIELKEVTNILDTLPKTVIRKPINSKCEKRSWSVNTNNQQIRMLKRAYNNFKTTGNPQMKISIK